MYFLVFFFFSSRRRHTRCSRDWSSDVCSSDLSLLLQLLDSYVSNVPEPPQESLSRQDAKSAKKNIFFFVRTWCPLRLCATLLSSFEIFVSFVVEILSPQRARSTRSLDQSSSGAGT